MLLEMGCIRNVHTRLSSRNAVKSKKGNILHIYIPKHVRVSKYDPIVFSNKTILWQRNFSYPYGVHREVPLYQITQPLTKISKNITYLINLLSLRSLAHPLLTQQRMLMGRNYLLSDCACQSLVGHLLHTSYHTTVFPGVFPWQHL